MGNRYLASLITPRLFQSTFSIEALACDTVGLRGVNALCLVILSVLALLCRHEIENRSRRSQGLRSAEKASSYAVHTALNVALCPVIFFFSGLYYTDVASTIVVLLALLNTLRRMGSDAASLQSDLVTIFIGFMALFMRQTNVFWVVVFLGLVEAVNAVKILQPKDASDTKPPVYSTERVTRFVTKSIAGHIHDPPLSEAWPDGMGFY